MRYYIDTEFIEKPNFIELIALGIKCEDGRTFYAESSEFDENKASEWVKENVISKLEFYGSKHLKEVVDYQRDFEIFGNLALIKKSVIKFIGKDKPEFWGYYADYDWVVFCWLFGSMVDLPSSFPMYCKDLKQLADEVDKSKFSAPKGEHNALVDAIWNEEFHKYLIH